LELQRLWITDFRNYRSGELDLGPGLTVVTGGNGMGKTNLLEAVGYLATTTSMRGAPPEALVRSGCLRAVVRGEGRRGGREVLVEAEIVAGGRGRMAVNRQSVRRVADLAEALVCSVFSPDDLDLIKGPPSSRRRFLDDLLVALSPKFDARRRDLDRIVRQRTALLRQIAGAGRRLMPASSEESTLAVWDAKLIEVGEEVGRARVELVACLQPQLDRAYQALAGDRPSPVSAAYDADWRQFGLAAALAHARDDELRRGVCLVGPHRDDMSLILGGLPGRTHASQGEQRTLALACRLAGHHLVTEQLGEAPILLLDDVFSELDDDRSRALIADLPRGQSILTTTGGVPEGAVADRVVRLTDPGQLGVGAGG